MELKQVYGMKYKIHAVIVADSLSPQGERCTSFVLSYPRIIHAEMCRHRMLSRNTASSRAIPFNKMVKDVEENPFIPIAWQFNHKGMQGTEYVTEETDFGGVRARTESWLSARDRAVEQAKDIYSMGTTKQLCNRLLEPFVWTTEIITGTEWDNFFELRCPQYVVNWYSSQKNKTEIFRSRKEVINHVEKNNLKSGWENCRNWDDNQWLQISNSQAEIHIQKIAEMMWDAYNESKPKQLQAGEWHIPDLGHEWDDNKLYELSNYNMGDDTLTMDKAIKETKIKISTSHCAKISYDNFGTKIDYEADIKLHDRLMEMKHWSPFEHCARAMDLAEYVHYLGCGMEKGWCGNFKGFVQYRKMFY